MNNLSSVTLFEDSLTVGLNDNKEFKEFDVQYSGAETVLEALESLVAQYQFMVIELGSHHQPTLDLLNQAWLFEAVETLGYIC